MRVAVTRAVSPAIGGCELSHLERQVIDLERARRQHREYEECLAELGCRLHRLPPAPELADGVFVEDAAVVLDELAVITRPGAASRRPETPSVAAALGRWRPLAHIVAPATLDGGDVLVVGKTLFVGLSQRTGRPGIEQLQALVAPHGYRVDAVPVQGCLHLKSAVTQVAPDLLLVNRRWIDPAPFAGLALLEVDPDEPFAANALRVGETVVHPAEFPRTRERLEAAGLAVRTVDASELAKAEGGVSCCSLVFLG